MNVSSLYSPVVKVVKFYRMTGSGKNICGLTHENTWRKNSNDDPQGRS